MASRRPTIGWRPRFAWASDLRLLPRYAFELCETETVPDHQPYRLLAREVESTREVAGFQLYREDARRRAHWSALSGRAGERNQIACGRALPVSQLGTPPEIRLAPALCLSRSLFELLIADYGVAD